jgi:hypothetical protein
MRRFYTAAMALFTPILGLALTANLGCGSKSDTGDTEPKSEPSKKSSGKDGGAKSAKTEVKGDYTGTLKGKVTFKGSKPDLAQVNKDLLTQMEKADKAHCIEGASESEITQQKWRISDDGGLANVVVWIMPQDNKTQFFKVDQSKKTWPDQVVIDQPHCAFIPHVAVMFTQHYDPTKKKTEKTGQTLLIKNSAKTNHNTKTPEDNFTIPAGDQREYKISSVNQPFPINCNIHPWMNGYVWAFEHPYAVVTDKDGNFEIKNVPVGATVRLKAWHEEIGNIPDKDGVELKLEGPTTTKNIDAENKGS